MRQEQLALNTVSLRGDLLDIIRAVSAAGFGQIEFNLGQVKRHLETSDMASIKACIKEQNLQVIGGFYSNLEIYTTEWSQHREVHIESARLLAELGDGHTQCMVIGTDYANITELENPLERYAEAIGDLANTVAPLGVNLAHEFNWGAVKSFPLAAEIARQSGAANAGVLFDPAHFYCTPTKTEDLTAENVATIKHVHVDNMRRKPADISNCNSDRLLPDDPEGALDLKKIFGIIESHGYTGAFSIEMFSDELWEMSPEEGARRMYQSLQPLLG
jgi:2-keto-myo-inositol isomerase